MTPRAGLFPASGVKGFWGGFMGVLCDVLPVNMCVFIGFLICFKVFLGLFCGKECFLGFDVFTPLPPGITSSTLVVGVREVSTYNNRCLYINLAIFMCIILCIA